MPNVDISKTIDKLMCDILKLFCSGIFQQQQQQKKA